MLQSKDASMLIPYRVLIDDTDQWGFCTVDKDVVIQCRYSAVQCFSHGLAAVNMATVFDDAGLWGFIDQYGKQVIPIKYNHAKSFAEGMAAVSMHGKWQQDEVSREWDLVGEKWGFIDTKGEIIVPFIYDQALSFSEGLAAVAKDGKWGYIDAKGIEVIPFIYDLALSFSQGIAKVSAYQLEEGIPEWDYIGKEGTQYWNDGDADSGATDYSAAEEAHNNLINEVRQSGLDEMNDSDPYWRIAND